MTIVDFRNYNIQTKTKPLTILANEAEQAIQAAESNLADFIIAFQGYFREQEDSFIDYYIKHDKQLAKVKPVNPDDLSEDIRPINKKLQEFIDGYNWRKKKKDLLTILKYIEASTIPFGIQNMIALTNRFARIKERKEKQSLADTIEYVNDPKFAMDAQGFIATKYADFLHEVGQISKNIDSHTSELIYEQLYDGVENLESMGDLAVRVEDVFDNCSHSRALMIARTETMRSFNTATINSYQVAEIEQAQILVANDERTCEICGALSGLIVPVKEAMNFLPLHPRCRCDWIPVIGKPLLEEPSEEDLENFVMQHPDLDISRSSAMPKVPKWEREHFMRMEGQTFKESVSDSAEFLREDAMKRGIELSKQKSEDIISFAHDFTYFDYKAARQAQREFLLTGKWPADIDDYTKAIAEGVEEFIKNSPNYPKNKIIFRGMNANNATSAERMKAVQELTQLKLDNIINMGGTSSWTSEASVVPSFARYGDDSIAFILKEGSKNSASATHIARFVHEKELLISMDSKFKVVREAVYGGLDDALSKKEVMKLCGATSDMLPSVIRRMIEDFNGIVGERWWIIVTEI